MREADAAEAAADARAAHELLVAHLFGPDGRVFWRPGRLRRLGQLVELGDLVPAWGHCRWVLAQALQDVGPHSRPLVAGAVDAAVEVRGIPVDAEEKVRLVDHDWVFRQVHLYELGGLRRFLRDVASPALLARADGIEEWAHAPMGGFRLLAETPAALLWHRLATGETVSTPNLGAGTLVGEGECAVGRLVPADPTGPGEHWMFETAPLLVPDEAAERVAADPDDWLDALREACRGPWGPGLGLMIAWAHDYGLLTDAAPVDWPAVSSADDLVTWTQVEHEPHEWAGLAAALLEPGVAGLVGSTARPRHRATLSRLAGALAGPAGPLCGSLAARLERSA